MNARCNLPCSFSRQILSHIVETVGLGMPLPRSCRLPFIHEVHAEVHTGLEQLPCFLQPGNFASWNWSKLFHLEKVVLLSSFGAPKLGMVWSLHECLFHKRYFICIYFVFTWWHHRTFCSSKRKAYLVEIAISRTEPDWHMQAAVQVAIWATTVWGMPHATSHLNFPHGSSWIWMQILWCMSLWWKITGTVHGTSPVPSIQPVVHTATCTYESSWFCS